MEGLQRSGISFRRQGSSGLVWDDKLIQELNQAAEKEKEKEKEKDGIISSSSELLDQKDDAHQKPDLRRTKSDGGGAKRTYRTVKVEQAEDPPSPRLSACGFCSVFGKNNNNTTDKNKNNKKKNGKPKHHNK